MRSRKRITTSMVMAGAMAVALAVPASAHNGTVADPAHVFVFQGVASVNDGAGEGLFFPGFDPAGPLAAKNATWTFSTDPLTTPNNAIHPAVTTDPLGAVGADVCTTLQDVIDGAPLGGLTAGGTCEIVASGRLGAVGTVYGVARLGGWCALSAGHGGVGNFSSAPGDDHDLSGVGWASSAGSILPVTGHWEQTPQGPGANNGTLVALVQAVGTNLAADCRDAAATGTGATSFFVRGVAAAK